MEGLELLRGGERGERGGERKKERRRDKNNCWLAGRPGQLNGGGENGGEKWKKCDV